MMADRLANPTAPILCGRTTTLAPLHCSHLDRPADRLANPPGKPTATAAQPPGRAPPGKRNGASDPRERRPDHPLVEELPGFVFVVHAGQQQSFLYLPLAV